MFLRAHERARQSAQLRPRLMVSGVVAAVVGAIMTFWLPNSGMRLWVLIVMKYPADPE
jgi:type IV secretory pathway TrbD component